MEKTVFIKGIGSYEERQYTKQDGTVDTFKSLGIVMKHGGDEMYGEMTGEVAFKNRNLQCRTDVAYVVKGYWRHRTWNDQLGKLRHENSLVVTDLQAL